MTPPTLPVVIAVRCCGLTLPVPPEPSRAWWQAYWAWSRAHSPSGPGREHEWELVEGEAGMVTSGNRGGLTK